MSKRDLCGYVLKGLLTAAVIVVAIFGAEVAVTGSCANGLHELDGSWISSVECVEERRFSFSYTAAALAIMVAQLFLLAVGHIVYVILKNRKVKK